MTSDPIEVVVEEWVKRVIFEGMGLGGAGPRPGVGPSPRHLTKIKKPAYKLLNGNNLYDLRPHRSSSWTTF